MKSTLWKKDFTMVVIGQIISLFGNGVLRFALPLYLLRQSGSAAVFGAVNALAFLPMIVLSFLGGIVADRVNKRNIMVILDFFTALLALSILLLLGRVPLVALLAVGMLLLYGINGAYQPAVQASIPALVPTGQVLTAGAVVNQIAALAGLLGPIAGGALFAALGLVPVLTISGLCFFLSAILELFITIPHQKRENARGICETIKADTRESWQFVGKQCPMILGVIVLAAMLNLVVSAMIMVGIPVLVVNTLGLSDQLLGVAQGSLALGGLCGGILTAVCGSRLRQRDCYLLLVVSGLCVLGMAMPLLLGAKALTSYLTLILMSFLLMIGTTMFSVRMMAIVQTQTPPELVGKVIALILSLSICAQPVGQAAYGLLFQRFADSTGWLLLLVAVLAVVIAVGSKRVFRES